MHKVSKVSSQKKKDRARGKRKDKAEKKELVKQWRQKAGAKAQSKALEAVVPQASKTGKTRKKASARMKLSHWKKMKKKQAKKAAAAKQAQAEEKDKSEQAVWCGAVGRVVGETAEPALQGQVVTVQKVKGSKLLCLLPGQNSQWISKADLECPVVTQAARQTMAPRQLKEAAKQSYQHRPEQQIAVYKLGQLVTDDQLLAGWDEICRRLQPGSAVRCVTPAESKLAAEEGLLSQAMADFQADSKSLLLVPIHSAGPNHWSLLALRKTGKTGSSTDEAEIQYFDSLKVQAETAKEAASKVLQTCFQAEKQLPAPINRFHQADGFSCGLWCLQYMERQVREFLGCSQSTWQTAAELSQKLKSWQEAVLKEKALHKAAETVLAKLAEAKEADSEKPPLPPPDAPPPDTSQPEETGKKKKKGKGPVENILGFDQQFGCSKCKYAQTGCKDCNPAKMLRWAEKQLVKDKAEELKKK